MANCSFKLVSSLFFFIAKSTFQCQFLGYCFSEREGIVGTPEKPLSDLGKVSYRSYWWWVLIGVLDRELGSGTGRIEAGRISVNDLSELSGIHVDDIVETFKTLQLIKYWHGKYFYLSFLQENMNKIINNTKLRWSRCANQPEDNFTNQTIATVPPAKVDPPEICGTLDARQREYVDTLREEWQQFVRKLQYDTLICFFTFISFVISYKNSIFYFIFFCLIKIWLNQLHRFYIACLFYWKQFLIFVSRDFLIFNLCIMADEDFDKQLRKVCTTLRTMTKLRILGVPRIASTNTG